MLLSFAGAVTLLTGCPEDKPATPPTPVAPATPPPATPPPATPPAGTPPAANPAGTPPAAAGATGSLKGSVAFAGKAPALPPINRAADAFCGGKAKTMPDDTVMVNKNNTLKNVLVRVTNVAGTFPAPTTNAEIKQDNCTYTPRVQGMVSGQTISIKNGDATLHNVHTFKGTTSWFNQAQLAGSAAIDKKMPDGAVVVKFKCDVHPWMTGYVAVNPNPFFAVTGDDGSFEIKDVPAGKYTVEAWHEKYGVKTADVTIAAGAPAEAKFEFKE
jgi:hypothetical protein